ncbi:amino acid adenylation domain-containing protein [Acidobacteriota bacterium]
MVEAANYNLVVEIVLFGDIDIDLVYNREYFEPGAIERMSGHFCLIMENIIKNPIQPVHEIDILSEKEKLQLLVDFNDTTVDYPRDMTIHELFAEQVEQTPDYIAVTGPLAIEYRTYMTHMTYISYRELNEKSNQLASLLKEKGVGPDTITAIMVERSLEMIIGILGILKTGGAYLPIDPDYPVERINYMLADSGAEILLKNDDFTPEAFNNCPKGASSHLHLSPAPATSLAYIMYTSGSTGRPKGVLVDHMNVVRLVINTNYVELTGETRILQTGAPVFDATTFEIWGTLLNGGQLVLVSNDIILNARLLGKTLAKYKITTLWLTSPLFNQLVQQNSHIFSGLKYLLVGGDVLSPQTINRSRDENRGLNIINGYGPTENTTFSTTYLVEKDSRENIPIGKPISNSTAYILDRYGCLQPVGVYGELFVGGDGVARGYLNNPELTAEKFCLQRPGGIVKGTGKDHMQSCNHASRQPCIQATMQLSTHHSPQYPIYCTGDLARWLPDGNIEFLGRIDQQVKIRGFRVELGEIESYIRKYPQIKETVVLAREDQPGEIYLCAYIVKKENFVLPGLRDYLSSALPDFMVPAYFVPVDKIPLTPNGKVDRKALPEPETKTGETYAATTNEIEKQLVTIWAQILGRDASHASQLHESIGIDDNFFRLGGHSLKTISLSSRIHKKLDLLITPEVIFQNPTIRELARYIEHTTAVDPFPAPELTEKQEYYPLSRNQQSFYVLHQYHKESTLLNVPLVIPLDGDVKVEQVEATFTGLLRRHESLRTSFHIVGDEPVQKIHGKVDFEIEGTRGLAPLPNGSAVRNPQLTGTIKNFIRPFELSRAPLLRVGLVKVEEEKYLLITDMHHIITDGSSGNILVREFMVLYQGKGGETLSPAAFQYRDFVQWQKRLAATGKIQEHEVYWLKKLSGDLPVLDMPTDLPRPSQKSYEGDSFGFQLEKGLSEGIRRLARETGTTLYMVLLTAYTILLHKITGQTDIIIGSPTAGRNHILLENTVGLLMDSLMMRNYPTEAKTVTAFLKEVRQTVLEAFEHQMYPFEELLKKAAYKKIPGRSPITDVALTVLNIFDAETGKFFDRKSIDPRPAPHEAYFHKTSKVDVTISVLDTGATSEIPCVLEYCTTLYKRKSMERFAARFQQVLREIVENPQMRLWEIDMVAPGEKQELTGGLPPDYRCYPLTHPQKRIYYTEKVYPGTSCNTVAFTVRWGKIPDKELLETAVNTIISRNEGLRLRILELDSTVEPCQYVAPYERLTLDSLDFSGPEKEAEVDKWIDKKNREPIPLLNSNLFYFAYVRFNHSESGCYMKLHHIITDGWTSFFLINEIHSLYRHMEAGNPGDVDQTANPSYIQYIRDERNYLHSPGFEEDREFWHRTLLPLPEAAGLSSRKGTPPDIRGGVEILPFPLQLRTRMHNYCKEHGTSLFKLICACLSIYLSRAVSSHDIVIGSVNHNRSTLWQKQMMGMFVSTILFRVRVEEKLYFADFVEKIGQHINRVIKNHQKYPFDVLIDEIRKKTRQDPMYLLDVNLIGHGYEKNDELTIRRHFPGYESSPLSLHIDLGNHDIQGVLEIEWNYQHACFSPEEIRSMHQGLVNILTAALENPGGKIAYIELLTPEEKQRILFGFNDTGKAYPMDKTLPELFQHQVEKTPDNMALLGLNSKSEIRNPKQIQMTKIQNSKREGTRGLTPLYITYRELNRKANQLAQLLIEKGVQADMIVGIMVERSVEMIIGILGILKAGGAYLPIDPGYPEERIRYMLADSKVKFLVKKNNIFRDSSCVQEIFVLDFEHLDFEFVSNFEFRISDLNSSNLAYIIYTSGSTGRPKGVMAQHSNLVAYLAAFEKEFHITPEDTVLQQASYSFDTFGEEVYPVLLKGGAVAIPPVNVVRDLDLLIDFIRKYNITIIDCSPLLLSQLNKQPLPGRVYLCISGGDVLRAEYIGNLLKSGKVVYNTYGPTEATVCATYFKCEPGVGTDIPIGAPIANYSVYIFDKNKRLQPIGISGELCISGPGVTRGYLNNPELTAEKFDHDLWDYQDYQDAYHRSYRSYKSYNLYRTGDLARWLPDGNIQFLGWMDHQVQIRGFRVELSEIERNLLTHESVGEAVVAAKEWENKDKYLCAYIVSHPRGTLTGGSAMAKELRAHLSRMLPHYMVPTYFVQLQQVPITPNGKMDRKALPEPDIGDTAQENIPPRSLVERKLVEIWSDVLGIGKENISITANFFEIGGHSLNAEMVRSRIHKELNVKLPLAEIFKTPTIKELSPKIQAAEKSEFSDMEPVEQKEYYELSYNQKRLWFLHCLDPTNLSYHIPGWFRFSHTVNTEALQMALSRIFSRHDSFRTGFKKIRSQPVQFVRQEAEISLQTIDISRLTETEKQQKTKEIVKQTTAQPFDLENPPLFRSTLIKQEDEAFLFVYNMHHIISDGWSMGIVRREFHRLYSEYANGNQWDPEAVPYQYKDFAAWHNRQIRDSELRRTALHYWKKVIETGLPVLKLPYYYSGSPEDKSGARYRRTINQTSKEKLLQLAKNNHTTLSNLLFTLYNLLFAYLSGQKEIVTTIISAGRVHSSLDRVVGYFINPVFVKIYVDLRGDFEELLSGINRQVLEALQHQNYPFELLLDDLKIAYPNIPASFNFISMQDIDMEIEPDSLASQHIRERQEVKFPLGLFLTEYKNGIEINWEYQKTMFEPAAIENIAGKYLDLIVEVMEIDQ